MPNNIGVEGSGELVNNNENMHVRIIKNSEGPDNVQQNVVTHALRPQLLTPLLNTVFTHPNTHMMPNVPPIPTRPPPPLNNNSHEQNNNHEVRFVPGERLYSRAHERDSTSTVENIGIGVSQTDIAPMTTQESRAQSTGPQNNMNKWLLHQNSSSQSHTVNTVNHQNPAVPYRTDLKLLIASSRSSIPHGFVVSTLAS